MSGADAARATARTSGELLISAGVLVLLFVVWQLWWTGVGADRDERAAAQHLRAGWSRAADSSASTSPVPDPAPSGQGAPPVPAEPTEGTAFALVHVPRFGTGWQVAAEEGVDTGRVLDHGVLGHYPGTAMPGAVGDFAMAGHRVTYGHPMNQIAELRVGDPVVVETGAAWYVYRVTGHEVVAPTAVQVIAPVPDHPSLPPTQRILTITACNPEYSARQRYVVHAVLASWQPRSAGAPAALAGG